MDTPVRKYQKQKDYQRHKLFRKMKRRRRAAIEQAKDAPMKPLRRRLKIPKFEGGKDDKPNIFRYNDGRYVYQAAPDAEEIEVSPINTLLPNPSQWTYQDAEGKVYTPHAAQVDTGSIIQDEERNPLVRAANNYMREAAYRAKDGTLALQGKYTMPAIAASALLPWAGEAAYPLLTNPYVDAAATSAFAGHGLNHAINEGIDGWGDAAMTALELTPLGRLAKPVWNASKEGLQYTTKAIDNATRYASPSYDLYRTIGETTPKSSLGTYFFDTGNLLDKSGNNYMFVPSNFGEFVKTKTGLPTQAYYLKAPGDIDILKLWDSSYGAREIGGRYIDSGTVPGKFVSYGSPWGEAGVYENPALYEFPVGSRRGPSLQATNWKGDLQDYTVDQVYNYMLKNGNIEADFNRDVITRGLNKLKGAERVKAYRALKEEKYPELLKHYDTSIYGANQTVIPNERWNFDLFLKTPFWKYSENPISGQVQKELMMRWPEAKPLETSTIEWADAARTPQITAENAASEMSNIVRTVGDNGKIRLSLPSHTNDRPRQFVLEPQGNNKFYVHMRTWDGDHIPANLTNEEKQQLFDALYNELPEGAEILFPKSGTGYYGTRGTVAGLQRLARDSRFTPGTKGTLQYLDKDGKTVKTYEGTSFIKTPRITEENAANITPEQWTAAQDAAIARGDMAEAQRLRDLHFQVSSPNSHISKGVYLPSGSQPTLSQADYYNGNNDLVTLYHSSVDADNLIKEGFDGVEHGLGRTKGEAKGTIFASANPDYAADYSNLYIQKELSTPDKVGLMELKVPRGAGTYEGNEVRLRPEHIKEITKSAYEKTPWLKWSKTRKTDNSLFNIKSADAVTYDNNGVRIPLGERDNFNINDIRYDNPFINSLRSIAADTKKKQIISYLKNAEPVPRDILKRPLSSLDEDGKVQWSVANGINDAIKFLRSKGYKTRLKNLGYTNDEANYIIDNQIDNIRKADVVTLPKYNKMYSRHGMATPYRREDGTMGYQIALQPEKSLAYNPRVTAAHEAFHVGSNRHGIKDFTSLPQDIREHNASIRPVVNDDYDAKLVFERLNDEELRARALEVLARSERANMPVMDYINKWGADPIPGKGPGILRNPNYDHNANELRTYFTPESLKRYLEGVAGIAAPLAGGTALLGYNSLGQPVDTYKHGKDSGIHINPKNRGKFNALKKRTGKTTEQLTHSKNPLTRKRAIFAQNAKKWKH